MAVLIGIGFGKLGETALKRAIFSASSRVGFVTNRTNNSGTKLDQTEITPWPPIASQGITNASSPEKNRKSFGAFEKSVPNLNGSKLHSLRPPIDLQFCASLRITSTGKLQFVRPGT